MAMGIKNREKIINAVACLDNFEVGSVKGGWYPDGAKPPFGKLPVEWEAPLITITGPVYVVFSYGTPIAWRPAGGAWVSPPVRYSRTTDHHQSLARQGSRLWDAKCETAVGAHL